MGKHEKDGIEQSFYDVYTLNGIVYVPHYVENCYVGPGFWEDTRWSGAKPPPNSNSNKYSAAELVAAGAVAQKTNLWKRKG